MKPAQWPGLDAVLEGHIKPGDGVAVFIDAANLEHSCRARGFLPNYLELMQSLRGAGVLIAAHYYTADPWATKRGFHDMLSRMGITVHVKRATRINSGTGEVRFKANVDGELIVDFVTTAGNWDVAWLLSGDGDYVAAVEHVQCMGKRVLVMAGNEALSGALRRASDASVVHGARLEQPPAGKPSGAAAHQGTECCDHWFLRRLLRYLIPRHNDAILMQRCIPKNVLYRELSWLNPYRREEAREILNLLAQRLPGIRFGNQGLWIDRSYLERERLRGVRQAT